VPKRGSAAGNGVAATLAVTKLTVNGPKPPFVPSRAKVPGLEEKYDCWAPVIASSLQAADNQSSAERG
jgi:hypothetical protein